jgi:hypothetical protein
VVNEFIKHDKIRTNIEAVFSVIHYVSAEILHTPYRNYSTLPREPAFPKEEITEVLLFCLKKIY